MLAYQLDKEKPKLQKIFTALRKSQKPSAPVDASQESHTTTDKLTKFHQ